MRLTCPNCGAQYQVPDAVIPLSGRDVQCSNCGDTWFQAHPSQAQPSHVEDAAAPVAADDAADATTDSPAMADRVRPRRPLIDPRPVSDADAGDATDDPDDEDPWDDDEGEAPAAANLRRRQLDPTVKEVLREEAVHEIEARAKESGSLESQPELGLAEPEPESESSRREREAKARVARLRGKPAEAEPPKAEEEPQTTSRRDLLPDIEEINSSLRSRSQRAEEEEAFEEEAPERRRSFRRGFALPVFLAALGLLAYSNAPRISEKFPQAAPAMLRYVTAVEDGRVWLDGQVRVLVAWIEEKTGS